MITYASFPTIEIGAAVSATVPLRPGHRQRLLALSLTFLNFTGGTTTTNPTLVISELTDGLQIGLTPFTVPTMQSGNFLYTANGDPGLTPATAGSIATNLMLPEIWTRGSMTLNITAVADTTTTGLWMQIEYVKEK